MVECPSKNPDEEDRFPDEGTEILDEIRRKTAEYASRSVKDPALCIGERAYHCIHACVRRQYAKHANDLPAGLNGVDECTNQFIIEKFATIIDKASIVVKSDRAGEGGVGGTNGFVDNGAFRRYIAASLKTWFNALHGKGAEKLQNALNKRLTRLADAGKGPVKVLDEGHTGGRSGRWGLAGGPCVPSPMDMVALKALASPYPLTIDYAKNADPSRKRSVNLGRKGQLDALLIGILGQAQGTLSLAQITRIVLYKASQLGGPDFVSMDAPVGGDDGSLVMQIADPSVVDPIENFDDASKTNVRICEVILDFLDSASAEERSAADAVVAELRNGGAADAGLVDNAQVLLECLLGTSTTFPLASSLIPLSMVDDLISGRSPDQSAERPTDPPIGAGNRQSSVSSVHSVQKELR